MFYKQKYNKKHTTQKTNKQNTQKYIKNYNTIQILQQELRKIHQNTKKCTIIQKILNKYRWYFFYITKILQTIHKILENVYNTTQIKTHNTKYKTKIQYNISKYNKI